MFSVCCLEKVDNQRGAEGYIFFSEKGTVGQLSLETSVLDNCSLMSPSWQNEVLHGTVGS